MSKFSMSLSVLAMFVAISCTSGPAFVPDRFGDDDEKGSVDGDPDGESVEDGNSDDALACLFDCLSKESCTDQGGTEHGEMSCYEEEICCELDKGPDPDPGADNPCTFDCMASWLCNFRGTPHPEMACKGNNVCCERGGSDNPGDNPGDNGSEDESCEFDCVSFFECRSDGAVRHDEMSCGSWSEVCCEFSDNSGGNEEPEPDTGECRYDCVSFFECRSDGAVRHDEMSCGSWSEVCCEFSDSSPGNVDPDPGDADRACGYDCVRRNRCTSSGGTEIPNMSCEGNRVCCRF